MTFSLPFTFLQIIDAIILCACAEVGCAAHWLRDALLSPRAFSSHRAATRVNADHYRRSRWHLYAALSHRERPSYTATNRQEKARKMSARAFALSRDAADLFLASAADDEQGGECFGRVTHGNALSGGVEHHGARPAPRHYFRRDTFSYGADGSLAEADARFIRRCRPLRTEVVAFA